MTVFEICAAYRSVLLSQSRRLGSWVLLARSRSSSVTFPWDTARNSSSFKVIWSREDRPDDSKASHVMSTEPELLKPTWMRINLNVTQLNLLTAFTDHIPTTSTCSLYYCWTLQGTIIPDYRQAQWQGLQSCQINSIHWSLEIMEWRREIPLLLITAIPLNSTVLEQVNLLWSVWTRSANRCTEWTRKVSPTPQGAALQTA